MPKYSSFSAWVEVDGDRLTEYGVEEEDILLNDGRRIVSCWIPSAPGKTFKIGVSADDVDFDIGVWFTIDGTRAGDGCTILQRSLSRTKYKDGLKSVDDFRPFLFGLCQLTDEEEAPRATQGVGEIRVEFQECLMKLFPRHDHSEASGLESKPRRLHERSKKGLVHSVQLGEPAPQPPVHRTHVYYPTLIKRHVEFLFQYRPLDVLRADGIVPKVPKAGPVVPDSADIIDLTVESDSEDDADKVDEEPQREAAAEVSRLKEKLPAAEARAAPKGKKRKSTDNAESSRVKREFKPEPLWDP